MIIFVSSLLYHKQLLKSPILVRIPEKNRNIKTCPYNLKIDTAKGSI